MDSDIPLATLRKERHKDLESSLPIPTYVDNGLLRPVSKATQKKMMACLAVETVVSGVIYWHYYILESLHPLLAPSLLGMWTAALAQSINQTMKKKISFNRILKFMLWGSINGCCTVLWLDWLLIWFENLFYRILVDQMIGAPTFQLTFNILNSLWDHGKLSSTTRVSYIRALKYSYCFWPFFSICLFIFVPKAMMFPANCVGNLVWNIILSKIA